MAIIEGGARYQVRGTHVVILLAIFSITLLGALHQRVQADNVPTQITVTNASPVVVDWFVSATSWGFTNSNTVPVTSTTITPTSGGTTSFYVTGSIRDENGAGDIEHVEGVFYRSGVGDGCSADNNDCYVLAACDMRADTRSQVPSNEHKDYNCSFNITSWTDSTSAGGAYPSQTWGVAIGPYDTAGASSRSINATAREVATLGDLIIPGSIAYGSLSKGESTTDANNVEMSITQGGNDVTSVLVRSLANMLCSNVGFIGIGNQEWALADVSHSGIGSTDLSSTPTDTGLDVTYRISDTVANTSSLFWNIEIPANNISGVCTGVTIITEVAA